MGRGARGDDQGLRSASRFYDGSGVCDDSKRAKKRILHPQKSVNGLMVQ